MLSEICKAQLKHILVGAWSYKQFTLVKHLSLYKSALYN